MDSGEAIRLEKADRRCGIYRKVKRFNRVFPGSQWKNAPLEERPSLFSQKIVLLKRQRTRLTKLAVILDTYNTSGVPKVSNHAMIIKFEFLVKAREGCGQRRTKAIFVLSSVACLLYNYPGHEEQRRNLDGLYPGEIICVCRLETKVRCVARESRIKFLHAPCKSPKYRAFCC